MEIKERKENKVLNRVEISFSWRHDKKATPSRQQVMDLVRTLEPGRPLSRTQRTRITCSMVWNVDHRTANSSPTRLEDSRTFFLGPIPNFFSVSVSPHFQEIQK